MPELVYLVSSSFVAHFMASLLREGSLNISFIRSMAAAVGGFGFGFGWFIAAATLFHANEGWHVLV
jgi:hypothetical protein